ncbi:MAG: N-acetyltransferase family protein [Pseudomonadales bacterium]|nr:N-acetyltransferase family protein [Pseudomonadales bacterium]
MPTIRPATLEDSVPIAQIYNWYIENSVITFEEAAVSAGDMAQRIAVTDASRPWFVLEPDDSDGLLGYAYAMRWKERSAYRFSREVSIYLRQDVHGAGLGRQLYEHLIAALRETEVHTLIAGITLPNDASVALHEKLGFKRVGVFEEVGRKFDNYLNVGYWQLLI